MFRRRAKSESAATLKGRIAKVGQPSELSTSVRRATTPVSPPARKSILRVTNVDDSLHTVYGLSEDGDLSHRSSASTGKLPPASKQQYHHHIARTRSVLFTAIEIREYARTVGDNPSCSSGPPISIAWDYDPDIKKLSIDDYEDLRPERRAGFQMVLPREVRDRLLRREWEVSRSEIASAVREAIKIKHQRRHTVNNLGKDKMEEIMERAGKSLLRSLMLKQSTSSELEKLEQQYQAAEAARKRMQLATAMEEEPSVADSNHSDEHTNDATENFEDEYCLESVGNVDRYDEKKVEDEASPIANLDTDAGAEINSCERDNELGHQPPKQQCIGEDTCESSDDGSIKRSNSTTTTADSTAIIPSVTGSQGEKGQL